MKQVMRIVVLAAVLMFGLTAQASAETITFAEGEWAPFVASDMPGNGATGELVRAAMKAAGYDVKYDFFNWNRSKVLVEKGEAAASFPWGKNEEREAFAYISDPVQRSSEPFFYLKSKLGDNWDYTGLEDLKKINVAGIRGYYHVGMFEKAGISMDMSNDLETALKKLQAGRVDVVVDNELVVWTAIKKLFPNDVDKFGASKTPLREDDMYVLFSKKFPGNDELVKKFNEGLAKIKASGEYDKIMGKYK